MNNARAGMLSQAGHCEQLSLRALQRWLLLAAFVETLLTRAGKLSKALIDRSDLTPHSAVYFRRFGSIASACQRAGYAPTPFQLLHGVRKARCITVVVGMPTLGLRGR